MLCIYDLDVIPQSAKNKVNTMSSGKDKTARNSRIKLLMEKWRNEFIQYGNADLYEIQEVIENILDERFYSRR
jgi:hypothetical protein